MMPRITRLDLEKRTGRNWLPESCRGEREAMPPNQIWTQERIPRRDGTVANEMVEFSGPESFHQDDYSIFYNNVKDNVVKRIAAYLSSAK